MHFQQRIDCYHFDCLDCNACFPTNEDLKNRTYWQAKDDNGYDLGPYCHDCYVEVIKEINGGNRNEMVPH